MTIENTPTPDTPVTNKPARKPFKLRAIGAELVGGPTIILCLSEKEFRTCVKKLCPKYTEFWLDPSAAACVHSVSEVVGNSRTFFVCVSDEYQFEDFVEISCILVHEAVHIFQYICEEIGEDSPSSEFEAYSIGNISKALIKEYCRKIAV